MSPPTYTGLFVRNTRDADVIFFAVYQRMLPMCTRRLDNSERMALHSGYVYVWEESDSETDPHGIKRFTEGRSWEPSRLRDSFLIYLEKDEQQTSPLTTRQRTSHHHSPYSPFTHRGMIKKTYSVYVDTDNGRKKWHLNAYYTEDTIDQLRSIDDIYSLHDLGRHVPSNMFKCARTTRFEDDEPLSNTTPFVPASISPVHPRPTPALTPAHFTYTGHSRHSSGSSVTTSPASSAPLSSPLVNSYTHHQLPASSSLSHETSSSYFPSPMRSISQTPRRHPSSGGLVGPSTSSLEGRLSSLQLVPMEQLNRRAAHSASGRPRNHIEEEMLRRFS